MQRLLAPRARSLTTTLVVFVAFALALAGCGGSKATGSGGTINSVAVERGISSSILSQHHVVVMVSCPAPISEQDGGKFTCVAHFQVGTYSVPVTQTDGKGNVSWNTTQPIQLLKMTNVKSAIAASILKQRHVAATVTCPSQVLQQKGLKFDCTATTKGSRKVRAGSYPFVVTEVDGSGHVTYVGV